MARKIGNVCFPAGTYEKDGQEKTRWMKIGVVLESDKGLSIKLDAIPAAPNPDGMWLKVFEEDSQQKPQQQGFRSKPDDSAPF